MRQPFCGGEAGKISGEFFLGSEGYIQMRDDGLRKWMKFLGCLTGFLLCLCFAGCHTPTGAVQEGAKETGYTVIDARGTAVYIPKKPQRILSGNLSYDTIIAGLVTPDHLVAVNVLDTDSQSSFFAEEAAKIPTKIYTFTSIPLETVIKTQPDLIIVPGWIAADHVESYRQLGYPVLVCQGPDNIEETKAAIRLVAQALQEEAAGERVVAEMERQLTEIDTVLAARTDRRPVGMLISQMQSYGGPGSMYHELCTRARIENGIEKAGLKNGEFLSKELVVKANPDFFLAATPHEVDSYGSEVFREKFLSDPALAELPAVHQVRFVPARYLYAASQNLVYAIKGLANAAYGDVFDMSEEHLIRGY